MITNPDPGFELRKVNAREWLVLDHRFDENDFRRTVACLLEVDENIVEVTCLHDLPLARSYPTASHVLEAVATFHSASDERYSNPSLPSQRPRPIRDSRRFSTS